MRRLWLFLRNHHCELGIPHVNEYGKLVMTCYSCSTDQEVKVKL